MQRSANTCGGTFSGFGSTPTLTSANAFHPAHQIAVEHIRQGELWFKVDDYGRIHTNLTNLPKMLRQYLAVDGERLANIDISESQPLFMGLAIAE